MDTETRFEGTNHGVGNPCDMAQGLARVLKLLIGAKEEKVEPR